EKEIIVIDDGSTDRTAAVVKGVIARYPEERIMLISKKNGGKAKALNWGIMRATHDIVVTMDGDSLFAPDALSKLVTHFSDPRVGAVAGKVYTAHLRTFFDHLQALEYLTGQNIEKTLLSSVNAVGVVPGPIGGWRKRAILRAGGFSKDTLVEDQDMTLAVLAHGYRVVYESAAIAYTETPQHLSEYLKQRFRWVYGSVQCFWKYGLTVFTRPRSGIGAFIIPNAALYGIILPLISPIVDLTLLWGVFNGFSGRIFYAAVLFTLVDVAYTSLALIREKHRLQLLAFVPIVRLFSRQILFMVVAGSVVRAFEGKGLLWHSVRKNGEAKRLYFSNEAIASSHPA
ncbi:MAG: glycosyltransferase family 2 protein, partial [Patescibacteria group bacterium]